MAGADYSFFGRNAFYDQWDLSKSYKLQPDQAKSHALQAYVCPSRRSVNEAHADSETIKVEVTAPCGCGGFIDVEVVGGATGDYAGNHGDLSPGALGFSTDYYWGGNGTGVIISSRARQLSNGALDWIDRIGIAQIRDGASNTILAGELHVTSDSLNQIPFNGPIYNGQDLAAFTRVGGPGVPIASGPKAIPGQC